MEKLFESYTKQAAMYINEDDMEDLTDTSVDSTAVDSTAVDADEDGTETDKEEVLDLDLANPVCPSCGATLNPIAPEIEPDEEDDEMEDGEADAIELLQSLGYVIYKPADDEEFDDEEFDDEEFEDSDENEEDFDDSDIEEF